MVNTLFSLCGDTNSAFNYNYCLHCLSQSGQLYYFALLLAFCPVCDIGAVCVSCRNIYSVPTDFFAQFPMISSPFSCTCGFIRLIKWRKIIITCCGEYSVPAHATTVHRDVNLKLRNRRFVLRAVCRKWYASARFYRQIEKQTIKSVLSRKTSLRTPSSVAMSLSSSEPDQPATPPTESDCDSSSLPSASSTQTLPTLPFHEEKLPIHDAIRSQNCLVTASPCPYLPEKEESDRSRTLALRVAVVSGAMASMLVISYAFVGEFGFVSCGVARADAGAVRRAFGAVVIAVWMIGACLVTYCYIYTAIVESPLPTRCHLTESDMSDARRFYHLVRDALAVSHDFNVETMTMSLTEDMVRMQRIRLPLAAEHRRAYASTCIAFAVLPTNLAMKSQVPNYTSHSHSNSLAAIDWRASTSESAYR